jgi:hypothetical protein
MPLNAFLDFLAITVTSLQKALPLRVALLQP